MFINIPNVNTSCQNVKSSDHIIINMSSVPFVYYSYVRGRCKWHIQVNVLSLIQVETHKKYITLHIVIYGCCKDCHLKKTQSLPEWQKQWGASPPLLLQRFSPYSRLSLKNSKLSNEHEAHALVSCLMLMRRWSVPYKWSHRDMGRLGVRTAQACACAL